MRKQEKTAHYRYFLHYGRFLKNKGKKFFGRLVAANKF